MPYRLTCFFVYSLVFGKRLRLASAAVNPFLELVNGHRSADKFALFCPSFFVIAGISILRFRFVIEAEHHFVFVERSVLVVLVDDKNVLPVPIVEIVGQEHIDMVAIHALRSAHVAVGVVHGCLPRFSVGIHAAAHRPFGILNCDVESSDTHMPFLVVAGFFLPVGRVGVCFCLRLRNFFAQSLRNARIGSIFVVKKFRRIDTERGCVIIGLGCSPRIVKGNRFLALRFGCRLHFLVYPTYCIFLQQVGYSFFGLFLIGNNHFHAVL